MPSSVPTMDEFNALTARVTKLEQVAPIVPPIIPPQPTDNPRDKVLNMLRSNVGKAWVLAQMCHSGQEEHNYNKTKGINSAMICFDPLMDIQPESNWNNAGVDILKAHAESGGLVGVSLCAANPQTHGGSMDRAGVNAQSIITPGTAQYNNYIAQIDRCIAYMKPLDDAGIPVFHRYLWEAEGGWFWWNCASNNGIFSIAQYNELYDIWTKRVRAAMKHVICCWSSNGSSAAHYPARSKPELIGWDGYTDTPQQYKNHYEELMRLAPDALYMFAEFGSGNPNAGNPNYDNQHFVNTMRSTFPKAILALAWSGAGGNGWAWGNYQNPQALNTASVLQWGELWP